MLLVSRKLQQPKFDVIILDSDEDSDNIEQLDCSETQPDDDCVNDMSLNELISADEQPRTSSLDDQLSSSSSEIQLVAVGSGDFGSIVQHKMHLTDHQKLTLLKSILFQPLITSFPCVSSMEFKDICILDWYIRSHKMEAIVNTVFCLANMNHL